MGACSIQCGNGKVVSCARDNLLKVRDLDDGTCISTLQGHTDDIGFLQVNFYVL